MAEKQLVQSLARGIDILRVLAEAREGLPLAELVVRCGLKRPTLHSLVRTLESRGFVARRQKRLVLGPALYALAASAGAHAVHQEAERAVSLLAERLPDGIINYCEAIDGEALVRILRMPSPNGGTATPPPLFHPYATASGLAVQAFCDPDTRARLRQRHPFAVEGFPLWPSERALDAFLDAARGLGYVLPPFCEPRSFKLVASPVLTAAGALAGVLGVAWHTPRPTLGAGERKRVLAALLEAARLAGRTSQPGEP